jgi:hypothetical protein
VQVPVTDETLALLTQFVAPALFNMNHTLLPSSAATPTSYWPAGISPLDLPPSVFDV